MKFENEIELENAISDFLLTNTKALAILIYINSTSKILVDAIQDDFGDEAPPIIEQLLELNAITRKSAKARNLKISKLGKTALFNLESWATEIHESIVSEVGADKFVDETLDYTIDSVEVIDADNVFNSNASEVDLQAAINADGSSKIYWHRSESEQGSSHFEESAMPSAERVHFLINPSEEKSRTKMNRITNYDDRGFVGGESWRKR